MDVAVAIARLGLQVARYPATVAPARRLDEWDAGRRLHIRCKSRRAGALDFTVIPPTLKVNLTFTITVKLTVTVNRLPHSLVRQQPPSRDAATAVTSQPI
jgi:hypothetical protein